MLIARVLHCVEPRKAWVPRFLGYFLGLELKEGNFGKHGLDATFWLGFRKADEAWLVIDIDDRDRTEFVELLKVPPKPPR